jgi:predicted FMN-binding regulatory protein PaiB
MNSTAIPKSAEADDVLAARADERLAHAYEQIARADEQLARLTEQLTRMEQDTAPHPSAMLAKRPSRGRPALRGLVGLLAAAGIIGTALASQSEYGEAARPAIARWVVPYVSSVSWKVPSTPDLPAGPGPSSVRLTAAEAAPALAAPSVQNTPQGVAATADPELARLLQTMARDLATVQQGIEELKASQERLASDNAKTTEQLRASQEQMTRLVARVSEKASEQDQRARIAAPPPRPVAEPARKPVAPPASSQARAQPLQLQPAAAAR